MLIKFNATGNAIDITRGDDLFAGSNLANRILVTFDDDITLSGLQIMITRADNQTNGWVPLLYKELVNDVAVYQYDLTAYDIAVPGKVTINVKWVADETDIAAEAITSAFVNLGALNYVPEPTDITQQTVDTINAELAEQDERIEDIEAAIHPVSGDFYYKVQTYSQAQANALLNAKANSSDVYAKADTYNQSEVDGLIAQAVLDESGVTQKELTDGLELKLDKTEAESTYYTLSASSTLTDVVNGHSSDINDLSEAVQLAQSDITSLENDLAAVVGHADLIGNPHGTTSSEIPVSSYVGYTATNQEDLNAEIIAKKADLVNGVVPSNQLPSFVDDVLEYANLASFPATGTDGKIYVSLATNLAYRWGGTAYAEISPSIALGETSSTAYRGDRGKTAYDHSQIITGNPHGTTAAEVGAIPAIEKNAASGVAGLTAGSKVANSQLTLLAWDEDTTMILVKAIAGNNTLHLANGTGLNYSIYKGDGTELISETTGGNKTLTYITAGFYWITIKGTFNGFYVNIVQERWQYFEARIGTNCPVGDNSFYGCYNLSNVTFAKGWDFTSIGDSAFRGAKISEISLPPTITEIKSNAFNGCTLLNNIDLPSGLTTIGNSAFVGCPFKAITFGYSILTIGNTAFALCKSLKTIRFSGDIPTIGDNAFESCIVDSLVCQTDTLLLDANARIIASGASSFGNTPRVIEGKSEDDGTYVVFENANIPNATEDTHALNRITADGRYAILSQVAALALLKQPSVTYLIYNAVAGENTIKLATGSLTHTYATAGYKVIFISGTNPFVVSWNDGATTTVSETFAGFNSNGYDNPERYIEVYIGTNCPIGEYSFFDCDELRKVEFAQGWAYTSIAYRAFRGCDRLQNITLPYTISSLGTDCFYGCLILKDIYIPLLVTSIPNGAFANCQQLTRLVLHANITSIGTTSFAICYNLRHLEFLGSSLPTMASTSFNFCKITEIVATTAELENSAVAALTSSGATVTIKANTADLKPHAFNDLATAQGTEMDKAPTNKLLTESSYAAVYRSLTDSRLIGITTSSTIANVIAAMPDGSLLLADTNGYTNLYPAGTNGLGAIQILKLSQFRVYLTWIWQTGAPNTLIYTSTYRSDTGFVGWQKEIRQSDISTVMPISSAAASNDKVLSEKTVKDYVDTAIGNIGSVLDALNGEAI